MSIDVMGVLYRHSRMHDAPEDFNDAHIVICGLVEATRRTVAAFEQLGTSNALIGDSLARKECENALIAQKAVLDRHFPNPKLPGAQP
ncbi:hypothetical protein [Pseudoxanthomonas winnipegensis]|uniref:Uncharacterized protein n=1 Tax=Pseudoxanthomonas winnipegensis TaxID=2480810 RepID=A0A4Q8L4N8_9GAMM|nr:hypothetical protein [Pseudoxanthomonas winnipegensis]TAA20330.1 hypothetical protein EA660_18245 [Pseudoxanthomonas winnipegensis]